MTCPYCDLPHSGARCPTIAGQMARLHAAWGRLLAEIRAPVERIARDPAARRILVVAAVTGVAVLTVLEGPRVLGAAAASLLLWLVVFRVLAGS